MPQSLVLHAVYALVAEVVFVAIFNSFDLGFPITEFTGGVLGAAVPHLA